MSPRPAGMVLALSSLLAALPALPVRVEAAGRQEQQLTIQRDGAPTTDVDISVTEAGRRRRVTEGELGDWLRKKPKGTQIVVSQTACENGRVTVSLRAEGEPLSDEDKRCRDKEAKEGDPCRCGEIGAFVVGDFVTIDVGRRSLTPSPQLVPRQADEVRRRRDEQLRTWNFQASVGGGRAFTDLPETAADRFLQDFGSFSPQCDTRDGAGAFEGHGGLGFLFNERIGITAGASYLRTGTVSWSCVATATAPGVQQQVFNEGDWESRQISIPVGMQMKFGKLWLAGTWAPAHVATKGRLADRRIINENQVAGTSQPADLDYWSSKSWRASASVGIGGPFAITGQFQRTQHHAPTNNPARAPDQFWVQGMTFGLELRY